MFRCLDGIVVLFHYCSVSITGEHSLTIQPNGNPLVKFVADCFDSKQIGGRLKLQQIARQKLVDIGRKFRGKFSIALYLSSAQVIDRLARFRATSRFFNGLSNGNAYVAQELC